MTVYEWTRIVMFKNSVSFTVNTGLGDLKRACRRKIGLLESLDEGWFEEKDGLYKICGDKEFSILLFYSEDGRVVDLLVLTLKGNEGK